MITFEKALAAILSNTCSLPTNKIPVENSIGSVLQEDVYSKLEMPPFNKSAMDGYAINAGYIKKVPVRLKCIGLIQAGDNFRKKVNCGECVKIMTGAPIPDGTDSVVMVENTREVGKYVEMLKNVKKGKNVCFRGEDLKIGQKVLSKGIKISSSNISLLATIGRRFVRVIRTPRVAILNTGGEIVPSGKKLSKYKIYNANGPQLSALLTSDNIEPHSLGIAGDNTKELKGAIKKGLQNDILLISGGVSMGDYDLVPGILKSSGVRKIFHNVKIKPGKPLFFGKTGNTLVFGIPGNPVSNFLTYLIFIRPSIYRMMGYKCCEPEFNSGIIEREFPQKLGRKHFVLVKVTEKGLKYYLRPVNSHGSADILALSKADGFMVVEENRSIVKKHTKIKFITWKRIYKN